MLFVSASSLWWWKVTMDANSVNTSVLWIPMIGEKLELDMSVRLLGIVYWELLDWITVQ